MDVDELLTFEDAEKRINEIAEVKYLAISDLPGSNHSSIPGTRP